MTEEARLRSEALFFGFADAAGQVFWIASVLPESILYVNPAFERVWGRKVDDLYRDPRTWTEAIHPEDRSRIIKTYEKWLRGEPESSYDVEYRIVRPDGEVRWIVDHGFILLIENGVISRVGGIAEDITERKRAEVEREQYFRLFQNSDDLMVIADPNGSFLKVNPACMETLGYSEDELVAKPFIDFIHPDDKQSTADEMARQLQKGFSLNFENRYICKDGSLRWLSWRATYNKAEGLTYATARDITERKRAEEDLRQRLDELERFMRETVKREFRVVELKEKVAKLEEELKKKM